MVEEGGETNREAEDTAEVRSHANFAGRGENQNPSQPSGHMFDK